MKLYIKYMVSSRCKMLVKETLNKHGLHFIVVDLGEVEIMETLTEVQHRNLKIDLLHAGLELMDDKKGFLIEKIKKALIEMIQNIDEPNKINFRTFLSTELNQDYNTMATLFSEVQGTTIEQFIIFHKIERIKELMTFSDQTITEIAWKMNYSSVAHLSNQFKKVTGLTPSHFKQLKNKIQNPVTQLQS